MSSNVSSSGTGVTNTSSSSNSSTTSSTSKSTTSSDNCNLIDNSGTSSGITSGNSCISDESDESSLHITNSKIENGFPINTIKYNAKTNILQQAANYPIKSYIKKNDLIEPQLLKSGGIKNFVKFQNNKSAFNSNSKLMLGTLLECQTTIDSSRNYTPPSSSQNSSTKEDNEYSDEFCYNPNGSEEFSGISLDVDNSTSSSKEMKNYRINMSNKTNKVLILNNFNDTNPYVNNIDYYNSNNNSSSASLTPVESSAYSTTSISPPLILKALPLSQSITQATASSSSSAAMSSQLQSSSTVNKKMNYENLVSSYQYTGPFPLNSQYQNTDSSLDAQKQMFQLNSSSSLTLVSKAPSMSYCYMNNDNNSSSNDIFAKACTEPYNLETARTSVLTGTISSTASSTSSSSSSGCSSLENNNNQFFHKAANDKNVQFERINQMNEKTRPTNSTFIVGNQQRNTDSLNRQYSNGQNMKKYQHFSTYKPLLKSSHNESYLNGQQPLISGSIKLNQTSGSNNTINKYTPYNAKKGDFV